MGIFGSKGLTDESVVMATLVTLGQSIHAVGQASQHSLNEAWDIFINSLGAMVDATLISEDIGFMITEIVKFPDDHDISLDLLKLRSRLSAVQNFVDSNQRAFEIEFSPNAIDSRIDWSPSIFADKLTSRSKRSFPTFGESIKDQEFIAVMGVYMMTLVSDTQNDSRSNRTFRRITGYQFALRWLAEWNLREPLKN
jgi:hypothetical protein